MTRGEDVCIGQLPLNHKELLGFEYEAFTLYISITWYITRIDTHFAHASAMLQRIVYYATQTSKRPEHTYFIGSRPQVAAPAQDATQEGGHNMY